MLLDPLIVKAISIGFGIFLFLTATHKLVNVEKFQMILSEYRLLPEKIVPIFSFVIPCIELTLGTAWLLGFYFSEFTAISTALLLFLYAAAMGINIRRGRAYIDCGCNLSSTSEDGQHLTTGHLFRNGILMITALITILPASDRQLGFTDFLLLCATLLSCTLLFGAANQLIANRAAINIWRNTGD